MFKFTQSWGIAQSHPAVADLEGVGWGEHIDFGFTAKFPEQSSLVTADTAYVTMTVKVIVTTTKQARFGNLDTDIARREELPVSRDTPRPTEQIQHMLSTIDSPRMKCPCAPPNDIPSECTSERRPVTILRSGTEDYWQTQDITIHIRRKE